MLVQWLGQGLDVRWPGRHGAGLGGVPREDCSQPCGEDGKRRGFEARQATKYAVSPDVRDERSTPAMSERGMWDALDEGLDPTDREIGAAPVADADTEGR